MATKLVNELDNAPLPLASTDKILVSRDGINVNKATINDLPKPLNTAQLANTNITAVAGTDSLGNVYDASGNLVKLSGIVTQTTSLRGVGHRGGWPNSNVGAQTLGMSIWDVEPGTNYRLLFVGAVAATELAARAGTIQAKVEAPYGSGNWLTVNFNASPSGTFSQSGTVPDESNNYYMLLSDAIPVTFTERTTLRVAVSSKNGFPALYSADGHLEGRWSKEFTILNGSTNDLAVQLASTPQYQINLVADAVESEGLGMVPRICAASSWTGGTLSLTSYSHGISTSTNNKIVLSGFVNSGATLNGTYSFTSSGGDGLTVAIATDPGSITQNGIIRLAQSITSATWSAGEVTLTRAAHGFVEGQVISIRGTTSTGTSINGDFDIIEVPTVDTYKIALATTSGTVSVTNGYVFTKYQKPSSLYHTRPYSILAESNVACLALAGDSTTHTVDFIQDSTRLSGVTQRCVGELFPFMDLSANTEGLSHWIGHPSQVVIREKILERYTQGILFGYSKNDESAYATIADWINAHNTWWARPSQAALANSKFNMAILVPSRGVGSRDRFASVEGQTKPSDIRLQQFHQYLYSRVGTLYHKLFDYASILTIPNQLYAFEVNNTQNIIVTTTAGSTVVTVDPSTPITSEVNGKLILLPGAGASNGDLYVNMKYVSPTKFIAMEPEYSIRVPRAVNTAISGATGVIGVRKYITPTPSLVTSLHENPAAIAKITSTIALKRQQ